MIGEDVPMSSSPVTINSTDRGKDHLITWCRLRGGGYIIDGKALIDCGADGVFMNMTFAKKNHLPMTTLENPITVRNVDRSLNNGGDITHMVTMEITIQGKTHMQNFLITNIAENDVILGLTWLKEQNPLINWKEGTLNWEWWRKEPESPELMGWIKGIKTKTINKENNDLQTKIPIEFHEYLSVFSEEAAHRMPTRKVWDHKIELKEDFVPKSTGIYKLTPEEDQATREFIEENLKKKDILGHPNHQWLHLSFSSQRRMERKNHAKTTDTSIKEQRKMHTLCHLSMKLWID